MRLIGHLQDEANARVFGNFLAGQEIGNQVEEDSDGSWAVWVASEDHLDAGRQWFADYRANPKDPRFAQGAVRARSLEEQAQREQENYEKRVRTADSIWQRSGRIGALTGALIGICVMLSVYEAFYGPARLDALRISLLPWQAQFLPEVRSGEIWRLITPIFLHASLKGNFLHLLFNMLWLKDLGSIIETRRSAARLGWVVLLTALASNLGQYFLGGPWFVGMSGVIYGLFGYIWVKARREPAAGLFIDSTSVTIMMVWFFLCFSGLMGPVANWAHAFGLVAGLGLGWIPERRAR